MVAKAFASRIAWFWNHTLQFFFLLHHLVCAFLVPWPGIKPRPVAVKARSPDHWASREFPAIRFLSSSLHQNCYWGGHQRLPLSQIQWSPASPHKMLSAASGTPTHVFFFIHLLGLLGSQNHHLQTLATHFQGAGTFLGSPFMLASP